MRAKGEKSYLNLAKGLNTESNPLNFPEGYTTDEVNFLLSLGGGTRLRRKGVQKLTEDSVYTSFVGENNVKDLTWYYWKEQDLILLALTDDDFSRVVVLENDETRTVLGEFTMGVLGSTEQIVPSFSTITDGVVVTSGDEIKGQATPPHLLTVNDQGDIEVYEIVLYFRDFELIDDNLLISTRPGTLGLKHNYNLLNAGWYAERKNNAGTLVDPFTLFKGTDLSFSLGNFEATSSTKEFKFVTNTPSSITSLENGTTITLEGTAGAVNDGTYTVASVDVDVSEPPPAPGDKFDPPTTYTYTIVVDEAVPADESTSSGVRLKYTTGAYPSNADIPNTGLAEDSTGFRYFDPDTMYETVLGNTEAPRGHYIYDVNSERTRDDVLVSKDNDGSPSTTITLKETIVRA